MNYRARTVSHFVLATVLAAFACCPSWAGEQAAAGPERLLGEWPPLFEGIELAELGAWDGINLDGGGTTTMAVEGADGRPRLLNRPIHLGIPGLERLSASHLGVKAKSLQSGAAKR